MNINDMRRIFREEMRLAGFKKVGSITWMLEFDEISWLYSLIKDRYGNRMTLYIGIDIKAVGDGTPPTNYIDCPIWGNLAAFEVMTGFGNDYLAMLFDEGFSADEETREAQQRNVFKVTTKWSREMTTLSSIQSMLKNRQYPRVAITRIAQPLIEGSTP
jgi:hypothetical protein